MHLFFLGLYEEEGGKSLTATRVLFQSADVKVSKPAYAKLAQQKCYES